MPTIGQIHIDQALTNLSLMYRNEMYVADMALPILPVSKRSDKYFVNKRIIHDANVIVRCLQRRGKLKKKV